MVEINQNEKLPSVPLKRPSFRVLLLVSFFWIILTYWTITNIRTSIMSMFGIIGGGFYDGIAIFLVPTNIVYFSCLAAVYGVLAFKHRLGFRFLVLYSLFTFVYFIYNILNNNTLNNKLNFLECNIIWCKIPNSLYIPSYLMILLVPTITFAWASRKYKTSGFDSFIFLCLERGAVVFVCVALIYALFLYLVYYQLDRNVLSMWR